MTSLLTAMLPAFYLHINTLPIYNWKMMEMLFYMHVKLLNNINYLFKDIIYSMCDEKDVNPEACLSQKIP
jgi:hypothetical protein